MNNRFNFREIRRGHGEHSGSLIYSAFRHLLSLSPFLLLSLSPGLLFSQISQGGRPASFSYELRSEVKSINISAPDIQSLRMEDSGSEKQGLVRRVGIAVNADLDVLNESTAEILPNGLRIWRTAVTCRGALALGLYFDRFSLPEGYRMFVYNDTHRFLCGAYTLLNNKENGLFSSELIPGDKFVIEIDAEAGATGSPTCHLSLISYVYRDLPDFIRGTASAGDCEVNINCAEGENWQYQKHGVARIYVKDGGGFYWCTGSLLNNTRQNNAPFFLTADHCGPDVTQQDLDQWIFYFNYEYPGCDNQSQTPASSTMNGATKLSSADTSGSDFLLLLLDEAIPAQYEPFFNGWSLENIPGNSGVTIHHPAGDVKKISTYKEPLITSQWSGTFGTHWQVYWSATENGWGVTEGGSSGSPLFDNNGRIIGTLTGGQAACEPGSGTGPEMPDYYGKFAYSWDQNGSDPSQQLKYWLDPDNTGITYLPGKFLLLTALFNASQTLILAGDEIEFTDLSSGLPESWQWHFEGGEPENYIGKGPVTVSYKFGGLYDVSLIVSDGTISDTLLLQDYISVTGKVVPNPTSGLVKLYLDEEGPADIKIEAFNVLGGKVYENFLADQYFPMQVEIDLSHVASGIYSIRLQIRQKYLFSKVLVKH